MTVADIDSVIRYGENGSTTLFAIPFQFVEANDLVVSRQAPSGARTIAVLGSDYTVTGGFYENGSITVAAAKPSGWILEIKRVTPQTQETDYTPNDTFPAESHERALDREMLVVQELATDLDDIAYRAILAPPGDVGFELPLRADRAGKFLGFDSAGNYLLALLVTTVLTGIGAVATRVLMAAIAAPANGQSVYLSEAGREGWFKFNSGNQAANVTLDTAQAIYVAPTSSPSGAAGAWIRDHVEYLNARWFGADNTGLASSVAAVNAAIAWANAKAFGTNRSNYKGLTIVFPDGEYKIDGNLSPITGSGVSFLGHSREGTILNLSGSASAFTWNGTAANVTGGGIRRMTMRYQATPNANAIVVTITKGYDLTFADMTITNFNMLCVLGTGAAAGCSYIRWSNIIGAAFNSGKPTFDLRWGSALFLDNVACYVDGIALPAIDRVSTIPTAANTNFIACTNGTWDTVVLSGGCNTSFYYHAVYVNAPGSTVENFWLANSIFDWCADDAIVLNAPTNALGGVFHFNLQQVYIIAWSGRGIVLAGDNANALHDFSGCKIFAAGRDGISISGAATANIKLDRIRMDGVNRLVGTSSGIVVVGVIKGPLNITNCYCVNDPATSFSWGATYGITIPVGNNYYSVTNCDFVGTTKNYNIAENNPSPGLGSSNRQVHDNFHADYAGWRTDSIFIIGASPYQWINFSPYNVEVAAFGMDLTIGKGAVDSAAHPGTTMDMSYGGAAAAKLPSITLLIRPGESLYVGYTGALSVPTKTVYFDVLA